MRLRLCACEAKRWLKIVVPILAHGTISADFFESLSVPLFKMKLVAQNLQKTKMYSNLQPKQSSVAGWTYAKIVWRAGTERTSSDSRSYTHIFPFSDHLRLPQLSWLLRLPSLTRIKSRVECVQMSHKLPNTVPSPGGLFFSKYSIQFINDLMA